MYAHAHACTHAHACAHAHTHTQFSTKKLWDELVEHFGSANEKKILHAMGLRRALINVLDSVEEDLQQCIDSVIDSVEEDLQQCIEQYELAASALASPLLLPIAGVCCQCM